MNNSDFGKTTERVRKNIGTFNLTQQKKEQTICIWTKLWYNKVFLKKSKINRNEKKKTATQIFMNKSIYLGLPKLGISKTIIYDYFMIT